MVGVHHTMPTSMKRPMYDACTPAGSCLAIQAGAYRYTGAIAHAISNMTLPATRSIVLNLGAAGTGGTFDTSLATAARTELVAFAPRSAISLYVDNLRVRRVSLAQPFQMDYAAFLTLRDTTTLPAVELLRGALEMQASACDPKGCLGVIASVSCGAEAESIRAEVIARRASADRALINRFTQAKADGDLPETIDPEALARYLGAVIQGLTIQASSGVSHQDLAAMVETAITMWPGR